MTDLEIGNLLNPTMEELINSEEEERKKQLRLERFKKLEDDDLLDDHQLYRKKRLEQLMPPRSIKPEPKYVEDPNKIKLLKPKEHFKLDFTEDKLIDKRRVNFLFR